VAGDADFRAWWDRAGQLAASPATARRLRDVVTGTDLRSRLGDVHAPALVLLREGGFSYNAGQGHYLAEHLPRATVVAFGDPNDPWWLGDSERVLDEFERFVAGVS
jgi:hypothetical protein